MTNAAPFVNPMRGREIAVVGIDGTGKSTLAARLYQALNKAGHEAILVDKHSTEVPMDRELATYVDRLNALVYRRDARVAQACVAATTGCWRWPPGTPSRTNSSSSPLSPPEPT